MSGLSNLERVALDAASGSDDGVTEDTLATEASYRRRSRELLGLALDDAAHPARDAYVADRARLVDALASVPPRYLRPAPVPHARWNANGDAVLEHAGFRLTASESFDGCWVVSVIRRASDPRWAPWSGAGSPYDSAREALEAGVRMVDELRREVPC